MLPMFKLAIYHGMIVVSRGGRFAPLKATTSESSIFMFFSAPRKLLFIHVYKTGGISITHALQTELSRAQTRREKVIRQLSNRVFAANWMLQAQQLPQHASAREVRDVVPPQIFKQCFKFAFVRNPWSLQLSLYRHVLNSPTHAQHGIFKSLKTFDAYIEWLGTRPNGVHRVQSDFLTDEYGQLLLNFVGRFEHLAGDFAQVAKRFGWAVELPHLNRSSFDTDFRKFYSNRTRKIVEELHQVDIETFGYNFNTCTLVANDAALRAMPSRACCRPLTELRLAETA